MSPVVTRVFSRRFKLKHETVRSSRRWIYGKKSVDGVKVVLAKDGKFCGRPQLGQTLWLEKNCAAVVVCNILESVHCRLFSTSSHTTKISSQPCARTSAGTRLSAVEAAAKRGMHGVLHNNVRVLLDGMTRAREVRSGLLRGAIV